ncbi:uncharacterized protein LOC112342669 [Selaginella moellendorffii]|uniref:uncharacterized protein LOC112342669 n=1 Tax=Selaginella moellendorffii TaxID=88036 RepID=UPI000D1C4E38|nr:uncharacterized protein LOC112342669 [Selaginella moellendorffii]|eukprot:XP_024520579.1 uncharacterized protein LOC112342669 [Selaginella moellendorffii]
MVKTGEGSGGRFKERGRKCLKKTLKSAGLQGLWKFLTADSYMYGALLSPAVTATSAESALRKEFQRRKKMRVIRNAREARLSHKPDDSSHAKKSQQLPQQTLGHNVNGVATPDGREKFASRVNIENLSSMNEDTETEDTSTLESSDQHARSEDGGFLDDEKAKEVFSKLVNKFGGRTSKALGIDVDKGDDEVEKWFLAVALFNRSTALDVCSDTFKNIVTSGITKLTDVLKADLEENAKVLERAGYTSYPERTAARLQRLALQLKTEHAGAVCSFKTISDPSELNRQLSGLFGLSQSSIRLFLREMRGVWPVISSTFDRRAENAARHLRLIGCKIGSTDERDVEAALTKLGFSHARHYRECSGGSACEMLN